MEDVVKKTLILLSIITGLLFAASLCYILVIGYSARFGSDPPTDLNASATAIEMETTEVAVDKTAAPNQVATNVPLADTASEGLTWNGLKIDITNANYDAWPLIEAQNQNNTPPLAGMTMLLITVRVTSVEGANTEATRLTNSDFQLIGNRNTLYKTFEVSCGIVPDGLDGVVDLGDSFDGNICFQVSEEEGGFKLIYEPIGSPAVYFDVPAREDNLPPLEIPPALVEADELTTNGLKIEVVNINYSAWPLIKAQNQFNQPPLEGMRMLLVTVRVSNVEGSTDGVIKLVDSDFQLIGNRGIAYKTYQASCGVVPDRLGSVVALGGSTEANVCFQVPVDERDFQLIYEPFGLPAVYVDLPDSEPQ